LFLVPGAAVRPAESGHDLDELLKFRSCHSV
jgi:hypothetical protein